MTNPTCPHCGVGIGEHEATRCLDQWVCAVVFEHKMETVDGYSVYHAIADKRFFGSSVRWEPLPRYSTDISAAWEVLEWLRDKDCDVALCSAGATWLVESNVLDVTVRSESAPLAICRAAVLAAKGENP